MIRIAKKAQAKAETASAEVEASKAGGDVSAEGAMDVSESGEASTAEQKVSLLGIGGRQIGGSAAKSSGKKRTPGEIRIQKDIAELDGGKVGQVDFPNPNDLTKFTVTISPDSGFWAGAKYIFNFVIPALYPHEPPKVTCRTKIYHPNINLEGAVCLNILRDEWKPVLDINAVIYGLIYLFYEPNPDDPLNRDAADLFRTDRAQFGRVVKRTLQGLSHNNETFERLI